MTKPEDFRKALNVAQPFLCSVYVIVCCVCYAYYGDSAPHYLLDVLNYNWTRTFAGCLMFVHMIISYTITQQVLTRALHLMLFPETVNALYPKDEGYVKGCLHWFGISTALMIGAYVFTGLIPFFSQMNSLIGALFDPLLCFVLPSIMLYKSGIEMSTLDKLGGLFYVFVVGVFAWGPGTGVAIYSIAESSDDVGGPFSCQCIAKQCST